MRSLLFLKKKSLQDKPVDWQAEGEKRAIALFHEMSSRVPAYKKFLAERNFLPSSVKNMKDFKTIPVIDKDNYLRKYSREELSWDGAFPAGGWSISTTSGSTGVPYYFPRQNSQDQAYADMAEKYLRRNFKIQERKTLYIVAFPMGAWIGGVFTYEALSRIAQKGSYDLSIITPGINTQEIINCIKELSNDYEQIIIGAYAPFLKDILDTGARQGIRWRKIKLGFVFSAEAFSETFRDYILQTVGAKNKYTATLNHYGTVDMGTMAHETPLSILVRRKMYEKDFQYDVLPKDNRQPTLCQYDPREYFFEQEDGYNLYCSSNAGFPLVRYDLKDFGGIVSYESISDIFDAKKHSLTQLCERSSIDYETQPFVYVYERNDMSVGYYAFRVYPDAIRRAIFAANLHATALTGKFSVESSYTEKGNQKLTVHVEMQEGVKRDQFTKRYLAKLFHEALLSDSSEYSETFKMLGSIVKPHVAMHEYGTERYFKVGTKQKWTVKDTQ